MGRQTGGPDDKKWEIVPWVPPPKPKTPPPSPPKEDYNN